MVAPAYADARSNLAKTIGLGRKGSPLASPEPTAPASPASEIEAPAANDTAAKRPGRRKAKAAGEFVNECPFGRNRTSSLDDVRGHSGTSSIPFVF